MDIRLNRQVTGTSSHTAKKPRLWQVTLATLAILFPMGWICTAILSLMGSIPQLGIPLAIPLFVFPLTLALSILCARAIVRYIASLRPRPTISVMQQFLDANGKRFERRHITQIYAKGANQAHNPKPGMADNSGMVAVGASGMFGVPGIAAAGIQAGADGIKNSVGAVSHGAVGMFNFWRRSRGSSIWINYGAKPMRIAQRLEPAHAELMVQDLGSLLSAR